MLRFLVIRDFVSKYKQTLLGPAWFVIQPLFMTLVFTIIFGNVAQLSTDGLPAPLFYLCGQLSWMYFSQCFSSTAGNLVGNAGLFRKVYFPRIIIPLANVISNLLAFAIQLVTFLCFWAYFKFFTPASDEFNMRPEVIFFPLLVLQTAFIALGGGFWLSALSAKYRDLQHVSGFMVQAWMYITPIIYPASEIPERFRWIAFLNPLTPSAESYRFVFLGIGTIETTYFLVSIGVALMLLITGLIVYNRVQRNFVDYS